jgi:histidinol dehydrogenase
MVVPTPDGRLNPLVLAAARSPASTRSTASAARRRRRARLRHRDDRAGRQDRRPGQRLCRRRQAPGLRQVGIDMIAGPSEVLVIADAERSRLDRRRPAGAGRARRGRAVDPDHRRRRPRRRGRGRRSSASCDAAARRDRRRELARLRRIIWSRSPRRRRSPTASRRASRARGRRSRARCAHPQCRRDLPRPPHAGGIGDYVGGSNHVLPTARSARFSSGLGVLDFMKRTSILKLGPTQLRALGRRRSRSAEAEGLDAHARSVAIRLNL